MHLCSKIMHIYLPCIKFNHTIKIEHKRFSKFKPVYAVCDHGHLLELLRPFESRVSLSSRPVNLDVKFFFYTALLAEEGVYVSLLPVW